MIVMKRYDYEALFAFFRPPQGSPDRDVMVKLIKDRRNGINTDPPDPIKFHAASVQWDYILSCPILALDEYFMEKVKEREEGEVVLEAKMVRADNYRMVELNKINELFVEYHMKVVQS